MALCVNSPPKVKSKEIVTQLQLRGGVWNLALKTTILKTVQNKDKKSKHEGTTRVGVCNSERV